MASLTERLQHAWNAFKSRDPTQYYDYRDYGTSSGYDPDRVRLRVGNERSIINAVLNRIAIDVAQIPIHHCRVDSNGNFLEIIKGSLEELLTVESNMDQTARAFFQDVASSMFDEGCVAIVPIDTTLNPLVTSSYDILSLRVGQVTEWFYDHVRIRVYNERTLEKQDVIFPKKLVGIVENPFFSIMNEPNSILSRLVEKLNMLDRIDRQVSSGKLDLLVQLPYVVRNDALAERAEKRRTSIEDQLTNSKYGIAYIDGTEKVIQLNRPVENNLLAQIESLTASLYSQLGITDTIINGTADDAAMNNYYYRTVEPVLAAIVDEMKRKFLTKTARTQGQSIVYLRDQFKLIPTSQLADITDKLIRNTVLTSNEMRSKIGFPPSSDAKANELRNPNINEAKGGGASDQGQAGTSSRP
jgi:predicted transcriptional regulator